MDVSVSVDGEEVVSVHQSQESHDAELGDGFLRISIGASLSDSIPLGVSFSGQWGEQRRLPQI